MSDVIDVSHHQGRIDWHRVRAHGIEEVYVKATEGVTLTDPRFVANVDGATRAGLRWGAYHFLRPESDPLAQAHHFLEVLGSCGPLPPVVDVEWAVARGGTRSPWSDIPAAERPGYVATWLRAVEQALQVKPIIYAGRAFWMQMLHDVERDGDVRFADYGNWCPSPDATRPVLAHPWKSKGCMLWQYTWRGEVPGIGGRVDVSRRQP